VHLFKAPLRWACRDLGQHGAACNLTPPAFASTPCALGILGGIGKVRNRGAFAFLGKCLNLQPVDRRNYYGDASARSFPDAPGYRTWNGEVGMSLKSGRTCVALIVLAYGGLASAQEIPLRLDETASTPLPSADPFSSQATPSSLAASERGPSPWRYYSRSCCCGPIGAHGGIYTELYLRSGVNVLSGNSTLAHALETGWFIQGGGRSLFFNAPETAAWTIDLGVGNIANNGNRNDVVVIDQLGVPLTIRSANRTFVHASFGREWNLQLLDRESGAWGWRWGIDAGPRLGTIRVDYNNPSQASNYSRNSEYYWGALLAAHADVEVPCGCCVYLFGFRAEYDYDWINVLRTTGGDLHNYNFLLTLGVRY
jgi:hypothetical protein